MLKTFVTCTIPGDVFGNGICYFSALLSANFFGFEFSKMDTYDSAKIQHKLLAKKLNTGLKKPEVKSRGR